MGLQRNIAQGTKMNQASLACLAKGFSSSSAGQDKHPLKWLPLRHANVEAKADTVHHR
jgi:hypothetical protein